jgi:DNA-directed RNA polymerase specialized sigma24 family protein
MTLSYRERTPRDPGPYVSATQVDAARAWAVDLRDALQTCDRLDAAMVRLVYADGFTYGRVAEHLSVPLARVESGVARGLQRIGQALAESVPR